MKVSKSLVIVFKSLFIFIGTLYSAEGNQNKQLKIVLMLGQSEMVGQARISTAGYMLRKPLVPPKEVTLNAHKSMIHQINGAYLYWQLLDAYEGPKDKKEELVKLIKERSEFKMRFKQKVIDELTKNNGVFRGKTYAKRRGAYRGFWLFNLCDEECEQVGLTPKIRAILDGEDNQFNLHRAYDQILKDSERRYEMQLELNSKIMKGASLEKASIFHTKFKEMQVRLKNDNVAVVKIRNEFANLAHKYLGFPIAKKTHIVSIGTVAGQATEDKGTLFTKGKLSVGYGASPDTFGLEYATGMTLEKCIDRPILIIKCAWNNNRGGIAEHWSKTEEGELITYIDQVKKHLKIVLANLKEYHPQYGVDIGYDFTGVLWFQGMSEKNNLNYEKELIRLISELRLMTGKPDLPIVCGTIGDSIFQNQSDASPINIAMKNVSGVTKNVSVVDTHKFYTSEIAVINGMIYKNRLKDPIISKVISEATSGRGKYYPSYMGSATFYLLAGEAFAKTLSNKL